MILSSRSIIKSLGVGTASYRSIITSLVLATISFFYIYTVATYFRIHILFFQNRITYDLPFNYHLTTGNVDHIIMLVGLFVWLLVSLKKETSMIYVVVSAVFGGALVAGLVSAHLDIILEAIALLSIPMCASFLIYNRFSLTKKKFLNTQTSLLYLNYIAIIASIIGVISAASILHQDLHLFSTPSPGQDYTYQIFDLISDVSPVAIYLLVGCILIKLIINASRKALLKIGKYPQISDDISSGRLDHDKRNVTTNTKSEIDIKDVKTIRSRTIVISLSLIMLLSFIIGVIPHIPSVNRDNQQIGTDSDSYVNWTNALLHSNNAVNFTKQAFLVQSSGERPLSLIIISDLIKLTGGQSSLAVIEHLPLILGPILVFVTFFLTRELTSNDKTSLFASFLCVVSFQTIIGIYAGYYANWIGLIFGYSSFIFLIKFLKKRTKRNLAFFLILTIAMLFSHQYTWTVFAFVMLAFLIVMFFKGREFEYYSRTAIILLILIVLFPVVLEVGRTLVIGSAGGILQDVAKAQAGLGANQFAARWDTLKDTVFVYLGGQLSNFIILFLGLYWLIISKFRRLSSFFIFIFLSIGIVPVFFGDQLTQGRILYDIPFQIPAAIALSHLTRSRGSILLAPICIWLVVISVRAVANFYFVPSPY
jgi:hypothetical protein